MLMKTEISGKPEMFLFSLKRRLNESHIADVKLTVSCCKERKSEN